MSVAGEIKTEKEVNDESNSKVKDKDNENSNGNGNSSSNNDEEDALPDTITLCASCDRCRARKTKCDGRRPCGNCASKYMKKHKLNR